MEFLRILYDRFASFVSSEARCCSCRRIHSRAKPFIESHAQLLLCSDCISKLQAELAKLQPEKRDRAGGDFVGLSSPNPYSSPQTDPQEGICSMCGCNAELFYKFGRHNQYYICTNCITRAVELIKRHSMGGKDSVKLTEGGL